MIAVVDYKMINLGSVTNMLRHVGAKDVKVVSTPEELSLADKIILPGVGAFDNAMTNLAKMNLIETLKQKSLIQKVPVLGICLGMQLMTEKSEEGVLPGLGLIKAKTVKFKLKDQHLKIPHMGWNRIKCVNPSPLFNSNDDDSRFYFVHSYYVKCEFEENVMLHTNYGEDFASGIVSGNIWGVQFHPEKSHRFGKEMFKRFLKV
jgi:glutamine amidotransferase